jgi:hypothetical protein
VAASGGLEVSVHDLERCLLIAVTLIFFSIGPLAGRQRPVSTTSDTGCSRRVPESPGSDTPRNTTRRSALGAEIVSFSLIFLFSGL